LTSTVSTVTPGTCLSARKIVGLEVRRQDAVADHALEDPIHLRVLGRPGALDVRGLAVGPRQEGVGVRGERRELLVAGQRTEGHRLRASTAEVQPLDLQPPLLVIERKAAAVGPAPLLLPEPRDRLGELVMHVNPLGVARSDEGLVLGSRGSSLEHRGGGDRDRSGEWRL
jgi:hypothetical protein